MRGGLVSGGDAQERDTVSVQLICAHERAGGVVHCWICDDGELADEI